MANFNEAFTITLGHEGGFVNHPDDPGGRTMYGISERSHPEAFRNGLPSFEDAKAIYKTGYWDRVKGDRIESQAIANELFDTAVNAGSIRAVRILQSAYNYLRPSGEASLEEDGVIGNKTLTAINQFTPKYEAALHNLMNVLQGMHYLNTKNRAFYRGWFGNRITAIKPKG